jgi:putative peptidoglycan lipid II flippase
MIATLVIFGHGRDLPALAVCLAWGSVIGSLAQLGVQLRQAWTLSAGGASLALTPPVREAVRNFGPVLASRGAVQLTAYIDTVIASLLPTGRGDGASPTRSCSTRCQVSLFGISISSAALPSIAADAQASDALERVRARVAGNAGAHRVLHDPVGGVLPRAGRRAGGDAASRRGDSPRATRSTSGAILAGSAVGPGGGDDEPLVRRRALRAG